MKNYEQKTNQIVNLLEENVPVLLWAIHSENIEEDNETLTLRLESSWKTKANVAKWNEVAADQG